MYIKTDQQVVIQAATAVVPPTAAFPAINAGYKLQQLSIRRLDGPPFSPYRTQQGMEQRQIYMRTNA